MLNIPKLEEITRRCLKYDPKDYQETWTRDVLIRVCLQIYKKFYYRTGSDFMDSILMWEGEFYE